MADDPLRAAKTPEVPAENAPSLEGEYLGPVDWFPVAVLPNSLRAGNAPPDEELMGLAKKRAQDASIFDEFPPTFFAGVASTNKLDSYSTHMHRSSLENFAADLTEGRVLLDSHDTRRLGIGYSLRGQFTGAGGNGVMKASGDWFSAPTSDDAISFIRKMKAGMVRDLSGGFYGGQWICDLCGEELGNWFSETGCRHWPGQTYEVNEKPTVATAAIHNARLAEVSAVYDGATPGAMILRARAMSEAGLLVPDMARLLETQYRIKLPASHRSWAGATPHGKEPQMADEPGKTTPQTDTPGDVGVLQAFHRSIGDALKDVGHPPTPGAPEPATLIRALGAELVELRPLKDKCETLETRVKELEPQAEDGKQFRADLRGAVEAEYVRALGARAKVELKAEVWDRASLALLKAEYEEYAGQAYRTLGGGRTSVDEGEAPPVNGSKPEVPFAAYRV